MTEQAQQETALLVSLGSTPQVVPEAWYASDQIRCIEVLTTASERIDLSLLQVFAQRQPQVSLRIWRISGLPDVATSAQQRTFEEVCLRWYLKMRAQYASLHVCLSGGRKAMSAYLHHVADWLGAAEIFHVLAPDRVRTLEQIEAAQAAGEIERIAMGSFDGWPIFAEIGAAEYALDSDASATAGLFGIRVPEAMDCRAYFLAQRDRMQRQARGFEEAARLPFPSIALWLAHRRAWLAQPLCPRSDAAWIRQLPKLELHCHLGGFATHGTALQAVRAAAQQPTVFREAPTPPPDWPKVAQPIGLASYMQLGDGNGSSLLKDAGCLRAQCRLLYDALQEDGVRYAEIRCSPGNYSSEGRSAWTVLQDIRETFHAVRAQRLESHPQHAPVDISLIIIATRRDSGDLSTISRHLALAVTAAEHASADATAVPVVGVDLAGLENRETRAAYFASDFEPVHRCGLAVTAHAGENDDVEGIWQAVYRLHARRLGHALHIGTSRTLLQTIRDRRIGIEMCPYANLQIIGFPLDAAAAKPERRYPLLDYLNEGLCVTVNTDNIGTSAAGLSENLLLLPQLCPGIRRTDILQLLRNAIEVAFVPQARKVALLSAFDQQVGR